ncbi:MAG: nucleoside-diphosphate kinase [Bacteroidia bacterium]|nr:nucleoside-diphosphate kinase [Bacteroidia bacterium]MDW8133831.1 nucleoside-diphosphate kinase [Bacteroidia bacterium]
MNALERTLGLIKPDAVQAGHIGKILDHILMRGFRIVGMRMLRLSRTAAENFYFMHRGRPFFESLIDFITSGPLVAFVLEREGAVHAYRELMGATDPAKAAPGTLRALFGTNVERNAVHGSDSPESARREIAFFFSEMELMFPLVEQKIPAEL